MFAHDWFVCSFACLLACLLDSLDSFDSFVSFVCCLFFCLCFMLRLPHMLHAIHHPGVWLKIPNRW